MPVCLSVCLSGRLDPDIVPSHVLWCHIFHSSWLHALKSSYYVKDFENFFNSFPYSYLQDRLRSRHVRYARTMQVSLSFLVTIS